MKVSVDLINDYSNYCKQQKRLSQHTIKAYRIDLKQFHRFINNNEVVKENLIQYINHLHDSYKSKSVKRKIASLNAFFSYLEYEEIIEVNPLYKIHVDFKSEKRLPRIIQNSDLVAFYRQLYLEYEHARTDCQKNIALRNICIMEIMISTGLRISEVCNINRGNINLQEKYIRILGKGSKERILQIENKNLINLLSRYKKNNKTDLDYFFHNRLGNKISEQSVRIMITQISKKANINQHITPHMFRHSFATMLLEEDVDIRYIQKILGHSSITTTQIYTHVTSNKQREILRDKNPRNRIII